MFARTSALGCLYETGEDLMSFYGLFSRSSAYYQGNWSSWRRNNSRDHMWSWSCTGTVCDVKAKSTCETVDVVIVYICSSLLPPTPSARRRSPSAPSTPMSDHIINNREWTYSLTVFIIWEWDVISKEREGRNWGHGGEVCGAQRFGGRQQNKSTGDRSSAVIWPWGADRSSRRRYVHLPFFDLSPGTVCTFFFKGRKKLQTDTNTKIKLGRYTHLKVIAVTRESDVQRPGATLKWHERR